MNDKKNQFRYSSPLQPKKLTLFKKTKEEVSNNEDVFKQISKILDESDCNSSIQEDKYQNQGKESSSTSLKSEIEEIPDNFKLNNAKLENSITNDEDISLSKNGNNLCNDKQISAFETNEELKIHAKEDQPTQDEFFEEYKEVKIINKSNEKRSIKEISPLTYVTNKCWENSKNKMTAFNICSLTFDKLKDNENKIARITKNTKKYKLKVNELKDKIRNNEKTKEELIQQKDNLSNEKKISDEKYKIMSETYSSYRNDVKILIDSLRNNLDKINEERNDLYNKNIEMSSEISSYKNKIEYINMFKSNIRELTHEIFVNINDSYFNFFKMIDLMNESVQECKVLFKVKKDGFILNFIRKVDLIDFNNILNEVLLTTDELYTMFNKVFSIYHLLYIENRELLEDRDKEWNIKNNKLVEEIRFEVMKKNVAIENNNDIHKKEILKYEILSNDMKEEHIKEIESYKKTIEQLTSKEKKFSVQSFKDIVNDNIKIIYSIINDMQNDFLLVQNNILDIRKHEKNYLKSLNLKNRIRYTKLREKYKRLKKRKNKNIKKISYPSESDIWDVFK